MLEQIGRYLPAHTQAPVSLPGCELQLPYHPAAYPCPRGDWWHYRRWVEGEMHRLSYAGAPSKEGSPGLTHGEGDLVSSPRYCQGRLLQ
jgi:hypothetical protein